MCAGSETLGALTAFHSMPRRMFFKCWPNILNTIYAPCGLAAPAGTAVSGRLADVFAVHLFLFDEDPIDIVLDRG